MTDIIKSILKRTLSEEIGKQMAWRDNEKDKGYPFVNRKEIIEEIKAYMSEQGIEVDDDYLFNGYQSERK